MGKKGNTSKNSIPYGMQPIEMIFFAKKFQFLLLFCKIGCIFVFWFYSVSYMG